MLCSAQLMSMAPLGPCVDFACLHPTTIPTANGSKSVLGTFDETFSSLLFLLQPLATTTMNTVIQSFSTYVSANQHFIVANQSFHAYAAGAIRICRGAMSLFFLFHVRRAGVKGRRGPRWVFSLSHGLGSSYYWKGSLYHFICALCRLFLKVVWEECPHDQGKWVQIKNP